MTAEMALKRGLVALWCLAAVGCAKLADEAAHEAATAPGPVATVTVPSGAADAEPPDSAPLERSSPLPTGTPDSTDQRSAKTEAQPQPAAPSVNVGDLALAVPEQPVIAPAAPPARDSERSSDLVASSVASPPSATPLDFTSLVTRLRKTKAINLRTKFAVKNESDDLLERFRAYHARPGTATLAELRRSYDSLILRLYSLLKDADPPLARDIDRSRAAIWTILADPSKFGAAAPSPSTRGVPQA